MRLAIAITAVIGCSCTATQNEATVTKQDTFTWNIQLAGYAHDQADQKGETDYDNFIAAFDEFPWLDQIEQANEQPGKCSPTLSVKDLKTGKDFWISMAGDRSNHGYLLGYIYPTEVKDSEGETHAIRWLEIYATDDAQVVKEITQYFFNRNYEKLEISIRQLEEFGQMEAKDLAD